MPKGYFIPFTPEQKQTIKDEYLDKPIKRLADELGTTFGRIMRFLDKNNLSIPKEVVDQRKLDSRKKKGDIPFNKGMKQSEFMTPEAIEKTKATRFKKGSQPHNTKVDGCIVSRKDTTGRSYYYIRISKSNWELYHRFLWGQHHGTIPKDHIVVFKDSDSMNVNIENLELITMQENMLRNSKENYPKEIIPSLVLINQLETQLKSIQNG